MFPISVLDRNYTPKWLVSVLSASLTSTRQVSAVLTF